MVGVPGRSKGCITCRKRKKGCDLKQPSCGQCRDRGTTCGYDSDRVFVYQNAGTYQKNWTPAPTSTKKARAANKALVRVQPYEMQMVTGAGRTADRPMTVTLPRNLTKSAFGQQSFDALFKMYVPGGDFAVTCPENATFIDMLPRLGTRDEALQTALLAVGTASLATQTGNAHLSRQSQNLYAKALKQTQDALLDPVRARSEAIFAVPRIMALYEILFNDGQDANAQAHNWLSHAQGEVAVILSCGPEYYSTTDAAHALFLSARFSLVIASIRKRKPCVFNEERWKTLPWKGRVKSSKDTLLDMFTAVPEILGAVDAMNADFSQGLREERICLNSMAKCWALHFQLEEWVTANLAKIYIPDTPADSLEPITFPDIQTAVLTLRYWTISMLLYSSLDMASGIIPVDDDSLTHLDRPHPRPFARMIARSTTWFFQEKYGITGATTISFPMGNALLYMSLNPLADAKYFKIIVDACTSPGLPAAIRKFLLSLKRTHSQPIKLSQPLIDYSKQLESPSTVIQSH